VYVIYPTFPGHAAYKGCGFASFYLDGYC